MPEDLFSELNVEGLENHLIFLDIDGTLTNDNNHQLNNALLNKIKSLSVKNKVYFCSNKNNCDRNKSLSEKAGIPCLDNTHKKPSGKILELVENKDNWPILVIGDKFLTDGLFAKNIGAKFIKVKRITDQNDSVFNRALYFIDDFFSKSYNPKYYVYGLVLAVILWSLIIGFLKYDLYRKQILTSDMALYPNVLWNTGLYGDVLYNKMLFDWYGYKTFLNEHFAPTILFLVPLYRLLPHPLTLVFLQTLISALTAFLVFALAKQILKINWLSLLMALGYLLHPSLIAATIDNVYGFHHDSLILPLVMMSTLFLVKKRIWPFAVTLIFLFGLKENLPLAGAILGAELLFVKEYRKYALVVLLLSGLFAYTGLFLFPYLTHAENHHALGVFDLIKNFSFPELLRSIKSMSYWLILLLFFPAVLAPEVLVLGILDVTMYFFAGKLPFYHHVFFIYALVIVAAIMGLKKMLTKNFFFNFIGTKWGRVFLVGLPVAALLFVAGNFLVAKQYAALENKFNWRRVDMAFVADTKKVVPSDKCLVTTSDLAVYFVNRHCLSWSEKSLSTADYILINRNASRGFDYDAAFVKIVDEMRLEKIAEKNDMVLFKR